MWFFRTNPGICAVKSNHLEVYWQTVYPSMEREVVSKRGKGLMTWEKNMFSSLKPKLYALDAKQKCKYWISVAFAQRFMMCLVKKSLKRMMASENQTNIVSVLTFTTYTRGEENVNIHSVKNRIDIGNYNKPWIMCFATIRCGFLAKIYVISRKLFRVLFFCASSKSFCLFRCNVYS